MTTQAAGSSAMFENYRRYRRYSISAKAVIMKRGQKGTPERISVLVNNISQGGMGFYTAESFERSTPVSVELSFGILDAVDRLEGRIASVCLQDKDYFTGIAFDAEIPYERFVDILG